MPREIFPLPVVSPNDYQTVRNLPGSNLPDTYDEWLKLFLKQKIERGQVGDIVKEIEVDPNEFARYCGARRIAANDAELMHFVGEKAIGNRY